VVTGEREQPIRIVLAKLGLDGHDRGLKVVARILRDSGMEVIYLGLRQTADTIARAAVDEDADAIGVSIHNGGHLTLAPRLVAAARDAGLETPIVLGGIVPENDVPILKEAGIAAVLGPGASADQVVAVVRAAVASGSPRA
jgi:methylmalonyl-CoA mutase C-terminal domain/subunit